MESWTHQLSQKISWNPIHTYTLVWRSRPSLLLVQQTNFTCEQYAKFCTCNHGITRQRICFICARLHHGQLKVAFVAFMFTDSFLGAQKW